MKMGGEDMAENITVESCPFDTTVPSWVVDEIATGRDDLLVVYPNEITRASSIQTILEKAGSVDSSRHTTLQRLLKSLTIDLRLPVLVPEHQRSCTSSRKVCLCSARPSFPPPSSRCDQALDTFKIRAFAFSPCVCNKTWYHIDVGRRSRRI